MEQGTMGWLIPLWILGAPFVLAVLEYLRTPKVASNRETTLGDAAPLNPGMRAAR